MCWNRTAQSISLQLNTRRRPDTLKVNVKIAVGSRGQQTSGQRLKRAARPLVGDSTEGWFCGSGWGVTDMAFPTSVLIWGLFRLLVARQRGQKGLSQCVTENCSSLWSEITWNMSPNTCGSRILPTASTAFSWSPPGSCALPEPHYPQALAP